MPRTMLFDARHAAFMLPMPRALPRRRKIRQLRVVHADVIKTLHCRAVTARAAVMPATSAFISSARWMPRCRARDADTATPRAVLSQRCACCRAADHAMSAAADAGAATEQAECARCLLLSRMFMVVTVAAQEMR